MYIHIQNYGYHFLCADKCSKPYCPYLLDTTDKIKRLMNSITKKLLFYSGLPQIQDFEIPDFFKTFSGPKIIFFKTANDRNFIRTYQKI